jgi:hypothetical protein
MRSTVGVVTLMVFLHPNILCGLESYRLARVLGCTHVCVSGFVVYCACTVSVHPPCEDADVRGWIGGCCESAIKTFSSMMGV